MNYVLIIDMSPFVDSTDALEMPNNNVLRMALLYLATIVFEISEKHMLHNALRFSTVSYGCKGILVNFETKVEKPRHV